MLQRISNNGIKYRNSKHNSYYITCSHKIAVMKTLIFLMLLALFTNTALQVIEASNFFDAQGPSFSHEPSNLIEFINTAGGIIDCIAHGNPLPQVEWLDKDNNPITSISKVRHVLANGSLYFPPFEAEDFRQDIHWSTYHCVATNAVGTIVSRNINVKAVVNQRYEPEVQNPGAFLGNNVLIKCNIPSFVKDYVTVTSWLQEPNFNIYPSIEGDGKNHMLPSGELLVYNVTRTDANKIYRCRTHHRLTQDSVVSSNVGKIQLTEMRELVPPIMNEKVINLMARYGDALVIPCVAYASPKPVYRWHGKSTNNEDSLQHLLATGRAKIKEGTFIINSVDNSYNGAFYCTATNSEGSETLEVQITVTSLLTASVQPSIQTVNLGKEADLTCRASGFPKQSVTWLKDGQPLRTGSRVRLLSKEHLHISSVTKEDKGMYQCFVKNDVDSVQATAEIKLGEVAPQLIYKFIEQTMQPGPFVSLKCSASGNPTPKIVWSLDGFSLPNSDRFMIGQYVTMFGDVISHVNISAVKSEDGGQYECKAISKAGEVSHAANLNIYGMPYVRPMPKLSAIAGKSFYLKCPVAGYPIDTVIIEKVPPKITPFSFARDLNVGDRTSIQCVIGTGDLPLTFTWLKDGKPLQANTAANAATNNVGVGVSGGHMGTSDNNDVILTDFTDTNILMNLNDDGSSGGVGGGQVTIRQNDDFTSALSITSVTRAQSGTYTCRVQNDAATVSHSALLRVNVPPRISPFNFEEEITEGMRTQLMCSSSQGDQPFNITWLKDDVAIPIGSGGNKEVDNKLATATADTSLVINEYSTFSSIISIHNVTSRHNGNYTCRISNRAGAVEYTAKLSVSVPPRWIVKPTDQDAVVGNSVVVLCKADGFPLPTVQWKQAIADSGEYRELSYGQGNGNSQTVIETYKNGSLIIPKVVKDHEGHYLCQANNGIGAGLSTLIKLTVHVGPTVTIEKKHMTVRRGDRVTLRCEADGDQPLDISWRGKANHIDPSYDMRYHIKDNLLTRGMVSEMTILQTVLSDRGEYSCIASNTYGHDRAVIFLQVQEPPNFPVNLHIVDLGSRSVTLGWSVNDQDSVMLTGSGNNLDSQPITNFILQYKKAGDVWHEQNNQKLLPGEKTTAQIGSLRPAQPYHFRLYAENHLGKSAPSDILLVQTDAEVPSGRPQDVSAEPLGPQQLLITWRPPDRDTWNGDLLGYTIAYQKHGSGHNVQNFTKVSTFGGEGLNDFRLTGLEKYTQYAVTVSAFNVKGDGPPSDVVLAHTLEDVPSAPPQGVTCIVLTAQNIQISWQSPPKESNHGIIQGYKLLYEPSNLDWDYGSRETKITSGLSTVLHGLQPFTNYTVQVLAFTRAGEGVVSPSVSCTTEEAVPDAPERVKSVVSTESSVIISWLPPRRLNGIITKYNVYIRILDKGQELKILKEVLPAHNRHFEAKDLTSRETYEAWVTASTRVGQGPSTPVIKLIPSSTIPAAIISFSETLSVSWRVDMKLNCLFVGSPKPTAEWKVISARSKKSFRLDVGSDNTLNLRNIQRSHEGNYSCMVRNAMGSDQIVYQLHVQVPPAAPTVSVIASTSNSITIQWRVDDIGGAPLRGFTLTFRKEFGDWEEIELERRVNTHMLVNLDCGTRYQFTMVTFNKIGSSGTSIMETTRTKGNKPVAPHKSNMIRPNVTSALVELSAWQDGGCTLHYFSIEFKRHGMSSDWIIVSSRIEANTRYLIGDLEAGTAYNLRVTAYNNVGSTMAEYYFETLNYMGAIYEVETDDIPKVRSIIEDAHLIVVIITSVTITILALIGACVCFRNYPRQLFTHHNVVTMRPNGSDGKDLQQCEQYYGTVRKSCNQQSTSESVAGLERIPEYSEDIYPYATFHLPEHENESANIPLNCKGLYEARSGDENTISSTGAKRAMRPVDCGLTDTEKRLKRCSKPVKSESEEYDSLNSDSEISGERIRSDSRHISRDIVSDALEESSFNPHGHSPRSSASKERLSLFNRSQLHKNILPIRKKENLHISKKSATCAMVENEASLSIKAFRQPTVRSFFNAIIPLKVITTTISTSAINSIITTNSTTTTTSSTIKNNNKQSKHVIPSKRHQQLEQQLETTSFEDNLFDHQLTNTIKNPLNIKHTPSEAHKFKPLHQPLPIMRTTPSDQSTLCLHSLTSSSASSTSTSNKHERTSSSSIISQNIQQQQQQSTVGPTTSSISQSSTKKSRHSPCAVVVRKKHVRGDHAVSDNDGNHKRSFSTSMEHEPFDNDLFDPPPKQHKQQQQSSSSLGTQSAYQQPYAKQQRTAATTTTTTATTTTTTATSYLSTAKNASGHTNMPSSISGSGEIRTSKQNTDNTERSRSPYTDYQYSPKSLPVSHIVQSGSYVEILKQGAGSSVGNAFTPVQRATAKTTDISPTHQNQKRHHRSIAACHNKSYGDFLTITPRRKGNKLVIPAGYEKEHNTDALDGYHHQLQRQNLPHSIEPLHLLGISDEKNYTFLDYRAMEAISNADTLEMGSSISGGNFTSNKVKIRDRYNEHNNLLSTSNAAVVNMSNNKKQSIAEVSTEYQYFMREKNLSPPTAFSDNILSNHNNNNKNSNI